MENKFPKLYNTEDASALLDLSPETLKNFRADLTGPNFVRMGNSVKYLEEDLLEYIRAQRQLPSEAQKMQAAVQTGNAEASAARAARTAELQALDKADREGNGVVADPYALTVGFAGQAPGGGMVRCDPLTGKPINAQVTATDIATGRADVTCAVSNAQPGVVPVPK